MVERLPFRTLLVAAVVALVALAAWLSAAPRTAAADFETGDTRVIAAGETIDGSLYFAGQTLIVDGTVEGDLIAAGSEITINGQVGGSVMAAGSVVSISGQVDGAARLAAQTVTVAGSIGRELLAFGGTVLVSDTATIGDSITGAAGELSMRGSLAEDISGAFGRLTVAGSVGGSIDVESESVTILPSGRVDGDLRYRSASEADIQPGAVIGGTVERLEPTVDQPTVAVADNPFLALLGLWLGLLVVGWLLMWIRPGHLHGVGSQMRVRPLASLGIGVLAWIGQIVALLSLILLAILFSLPAPELGGAFAAPILVLILLAIVVALIAHVYVAAGIGQALASRVTLSRWLGYAAGALIWAVLVALAGFAHGALGALLYFLAWFLALGALVLHNLDRRRAEVVVLRPPPAAPQAPVEATTPV